MTNEEYLAFFNTGKPQEPRQQFTENDFKTMSEEDKLKRFFKIQLKPNMVVHFRPLAPKTGDFYYLDNFFFISKKDKHRAMNIDKGARVNSNLNVGKPCAIKHIENILVNNNLFKFGKNAGDNGKNNYGFTNGLAINTVALWHAWVYSITINGVKTEINGLKLMQTSTSIADNVLRVCNDIYKKEGLNAMCPVSGIDFYIEKDHKQNRYQINSAIKANNGNPVHPDLLKDGNIEDLLIKKWLLKDSDEYKKYVKEPTADELDTTFNVIVPYIINQLHNRWSTFLQAPINTQKLIKSVEDTFGRKIGHDNLTLDNKKSTDSDVSDYLKGVRVDAVLKPPAPPVNGVWGGDMDEPPF